MKKTNRMLSLLLAVFTAFALCIPAMALERVEATADRAEAVATLAAEPIYVTEDFEDFELGRVPMFVQNLTTGSGKLALNDFIRLDSAGPVPGAAPAQIWLLEAKIVQDEITGNKCLEIECGSYAHLNIFGTPRDKTVSGVEGLRFDIRSVGREFPMTFYAGYNPVFDTDKNHKDSAQATTAWTAMQYTNTEYNVDFFGAVSPARAETESNFIYRLDNISYWKIPDGTVTEQYTITLRNSTGAPDATIPNAMTVEYMEAVELPTLSSVGTLAHLGWSETDGGAPIASGKFATVKDTVLYAVWGEKPEEQKPQPISCVEDFEGFELGRVPMFTQNLTYNGEFALNEFLHLDSKGGTATNPAQLWIVEAKIVEDEVTGSKCLEIECGSYAHLNIFGTPRNKTVDGVEGLSFDIRSMDYDFPMTFYAGYHPVQAPEANHKDTATVTSAWSNMSYTNIYPGVDFFGAISPARADPQGNFKYRIDNVNYWKIPEGSDAANEEKTLTFANPADAPESVLPEPMVTTYAKTLDISDVVATSSTHRFMGWSETEGGEVTAKTSFTMFEDKTLYAVWAEFTDRDPLIYTYANDKKGIADGTLDIMTSKDSVGYTHVELYYADKDGEKLAGYTSLVNTKLTNGMYTFTQTGSKAIPMGAAKVAARFYMVGKEDVIFYHDIPVEKQPDATKTPLYTFYAVSDLHLEDYWPEMPVNRNRMIADIKANTPDFVVLNGDLVNHGVADQFNRLNGILNDDFNVNGIPAFIANGNHEFYINNAFSTEYDRQALLAAFDAQLAVNASQGYTITRDGDDLWYSTTHGSLKLIVLSSPEGDDPAVLPSYTIGERQLAFLDAELADAKAHGYTTFVFSHVPLKNYVPHTQSGITNSDAVREILNKYPGIFFMTGHTHSNLSLYDNFLKVAEGEDVFTHVNDGGAVTLESPAGYEKSFSAGLVVEVYDDAVLFKSRKFAETSEFFSHALYLVETEKAPVAPRFDKQNFYSVRVDAPSGLRMRSSILNVIKANANLSEYGFLVALDKNLGTDGLTFDLPATTPEGLEMFASKAAYVRETGKDVYYSKDDTSTTVTVVAAGIPESAWNEPIAMRSYAKYDTASGEITVYGNTSVMSLAEAAYAVVNSDSFESSYSASEKEYLIKIANAKIG